MRRLLTALLVACAGLVASAQAYDVQVCNAVTAAYKANPHLTVRQYNQAIGQCSAILTAVENEADRIDALKGKAQQRAAAATYKAANADMLRQCTALLRLLRTAGADTDAPLPAGLRPVVKSLSDRAKALKRLDR